MLKKITKTDAEWQKILTPEQFRIMRQKGTEPAFSCAATFPRNGVYHCAACSLPLFRSKEKFESGTGWPSYFAPIDPKHVAEHPDNTFGMRRTEVTCARCDSHLGHVFNDGPPPTHKRYCINSLALKFEPDKKSDEKASQEKK